MFPSIAKAIAPHCQSSIGVLRMASRQATHRAFRTPTGTLITVASNLATQSQPRNSPLHRAYREAVRWTIACFAPAVPPGYITWHALRC